MDRNSSHFSSAAAAPCTALACMLCIVVFAGLSLASNDVSWEAAAQWGYFPDTVIWEGKPWALITSTFVHRELWHIAFNLYWLWILGSCFEISLGWVRWLAFFVAAAWASSSAELLFGGGSGIGMSGVGYALFGFGWVARKRIPRFAEILTDQTCQVFLIWLLLCIALTNFGWMHIANWAHLFGLAFGVSVAGLWEVHTRRIAAAAGLVALLATSMVPLFWCPVSPDWTAFQATQAHENEDYKSAIGWYRRALAMGMDPEWAWANLAGIYGSQGNKAEYAKALSKLRKVNAKAADEMDSGNSLPKPPAKSGD